MKNKKANFKNELETQYQMLIKANKEEQSKRSLIMMFILILTLISCSITAYFSYKAYKSISLNEETIEEQDIHYETLSVMYNSTDTLDIKDIKDSTNREAKVITITNEGDTEITFDIKLTSINTNLVTTNNMVYTISKNNKETTKQLPLVDTTIVKDNKISPEETIVYTLNLKYNGNSTAEFPNNYKAKIVVEQKNNNVNLLE